MEYPYIKTGGSHHGLGKSGWSKLTGILDNLLCLDFV